MSVRHPLSILAVVLAALAIALAVAPAAALAANGCGPSGFGPLVPDRALGADFHAACDRHDGCYATPWRTTTAETRAEAKLQCDTRFLTDLQDACYASGGRHLGACLDLAGAYYHAVRSWLGDAAYAGAQA
jgi:hypothetical protein